MTDGANPLTQDGGEPQTDWKAKYDELQTKSAGEASEADTRYKHIQRELQKANGRRNDPRLAQEVEGLRTLVGELTNAVTPLIGDETAQAELKRRVASANSRSASQRIAEETQSQLQEMTEAAGVEDFDTWWDSADMASARRAWQEGNVTRVLAEAGKALAKGSKTVVAAKPAVTEAPPAPAPVAPKLDSGAAGGVKSRKMQDLAKVDVNKLSRSELAAHQDAIYEAWERESGTKFKR